MKITKRKINKRIDKLTCSNDIIKVKERLFALVQLNMNVLTEEQVVKVNDAKERLRIDIRNLNNNFKIKMDNTCTTIDKVPDNTMIIELRNDNLCREISKEELEDIAKDNKYVLENSSRFFIRNIVSINENGIVSDPGLEIII